MSKQVNIPLALKLILHLNEIHKHDPTVLPALLNYRVPCNAALADSELVTVVAVPEQGRKVGLLGLLNGICGIWTEETAPTPALVGWGPICALTTKETDELKGFNLTEPMSHIGIANKYERTDASEKTEEAS